MFLSKHFFLDGHYHRDSTVLDRVQTITTCTRAIFKSFLETQLNYSLHDIKKITKKTWLEPYKCQKNDLVKQMNTIAD